MERVAFLIIYMMTCCIQSFPIDNGFTIKLKPISIKQDIKPKNTGTVFANPQQDPKLNEDRNLWDVWNKLFFSQSIEKGPEYSNQPVKLELPSKRSAENNVAETWPINKVNYLNLPVINQPYDDYKVLVAAAPPNVNIGSGADTKNMIVYVVFPDDGSNDERNIEKIPRIYFVHENSVKRKVPKKEEPEPILIVDNNRTVTGLKSKEVPKFVRFKNKLTNRFNYTITD